ncbi:MAG: hypothetical protein BWY86_00946 [Candidatus Aminicenantes bacterium ADurb.Bin508]|nr:MAG: hypothetical protein BWY86_00946 [Candidatus Aminicenantes bacterium ADurb.Bin508]
MEARRDGNLLLHFPSLQGLESQETGVDPPGTDERGQLRQEALQSRREGERTNRRGVLQLPEGRLKNIFHPLPGEGGSGESRHAEELAKSRGIDGHPLLLRFVHHVQDKNRRLLQRLELESEFKGAVEPGSVQNVEDKVVLPGEEKVEGDLFGLVERSQGVGTGKIDQVEGLPPVDHLGAKNLDRRSGEVRGISLVSGDRVEKGALSTVGLTDQDDGLHSPSSTSTTSIFSTTPVPSAT